MGFALESKDGVSELLGEAKYLLGSVTLNDVLKDRKTSD